MLNTIILIIKITIVHRSIYFLTRRTKLGKLSRHYPNFLSNLLLLFFLSFRPFPSVRGSHSVSSFSKPFCLQHPPPLHQIPPYLLLLHLKIFSLVSSFPLFLWQIHFHHLSSYILLVSPHDMSIPPQPALPHLHS